MSVSASFFLFPYTYVVSIIIFNLPNKYFKTLSILTETLSMNDQSKVLFI